MNAETEDPLLPVRLRFGGRELGGAMSWGDPKTLAKFAEASPFHGLAIPPEIAVQTQILAEPDADLARHTIAALEDGTPLVTRKTLGQGQVILFHITANNEWSNLPLSGLFPQMLERLAVSSRGPVDRTALQGRLWAPEKLLDGFGNLQDPGQIAGVQGAVLASALTTFPSREAPPGLYVDGARRVAVNALSTDQILSPADWPGSITFTRLEIPKAQDLSGLFLGLGLCLLALDVLATLALSGQWRVFLPRAAAGVLVLALGLPAPSKAQESDFAGILATRGISLGHVLTGDAQVDDMARAGLLGLSDQLWARTSIEPEPPTAIDLETDELAFFPFLYWPVTATQDIPSQNAYRKLNNFLGTGGMILFDTRDADIAGAGGDLTAETAQLQLLASGLDIPPLEPLPQDHVLTRSFYILADLPGRQFGAPIWVEYSAPAEAVEDTETPALRNANDGVTPVIIGGNDWAAAWAVDEYGVALYPVGRGFAGEDQRELAFRAGINIVMHALTGNYKSDQVHVPALLERLGQ